MTKATFTLSVKSLQVIIAEMDKRTSSESGLQVEEIPHVAGSCLVKGNKQQVMFCIGEVAAHGFDQLESFSE